MIKYLLNEKKIAYKYINRKIIIYILQKRDKQKKNIKCMECKFTFIVSCNIIFLLNMR